MILMAALALSDARLYEAADALGTSERRKFFTITLPGAKYGLISACMVVFTMAVSEFGVPKVIGGNTSVLAVDIYKQVIGQQNFAMGAVVGLVLLLPAVVAYVIDHLMQRRAAGAADRAQRALPGASLRRCATDLLLAFVCCLAALLLLVVGMAAFGSVVKFWPYNLSLTLNHYTYGFEEAGIEHAYRNSLVMATWCAVLGAAITFAGAYWLEKTRGADLAAAADPLPGDAADGGAGHGAGHRLHPVLQHAVESAELPVRNDGDSGAVDDRSLLFVEPPDGGDRAQADRRRVRVGLGIAEGAVLQDLLARHRAGVPAVDARHRPLLFRQRDDDDLGGGVPVLAEDDAGIDFDTAARRGGRDRLGGRDGNADRGDFGSRHCGAVRARVVADPAHAGVAQHRAELDGGDSR